MPFQLFVFAVIAASQRQLFQAPLAPLAPRQQAFFMRAQPTVVMWADPEPQPTGWAEPAYERWTEPPHPDWLENPYAFGSLRGERTAAPAQAGQAGSSAGRGTSPSSAEANMAMLAAGRPWQPGQAGSAGAPENAGPSSSFLGHGAVATAAVGAAAEPEHSLQGWTESQYERSEPQYEGWVEPTHPDWLEHSYPSGSLRGGRNTAPGTAGSADVAMLAIAGAVVGAVIGYATKKQGA